MDRASDSGSEGWGFESLPVYQKSRYPYGYLLFCCPEGLEDVNPTCRRQVGRWVGPHRHLTKFPVGIWHRVPSGVPTRNASGTDVDVSQNCQIPHLRHAMLFWEFWHRVPSGVPTRNASGTDVNANQIRQIIHFHLAMDTWQISKELL